MAEFHGGYFVEVTPRRVREVGGAIADVITAHVERLGIPVHGHGIAFATRLGAPVFHVAVQGPVADGRNRMFFHADQFMAGAEIARVAGANVYAYFLGPDAEGVRCFAPNGARREDIATLAALATRLGVATIDLYAEPPVVIALDGQDFEAVAEYCEALLARGNETLAFPDVATRELVALATKLHTRAGAILAAAWETAKATMHATIPLAHVEGDPLQFTVAPPRAAHALVVPDAAPELPHLAVGNAADGSRIELVLDLPERAIREIREFATSRDLTMTHALLAAYALARSRLHLATNA